MPSRPCPRCNRTGQFLRDSSAIAMVDYFRCDFCGMVWVLDQRDPNQPPRLVTVPKESESKPS
jgi:hypothetical protein